MKLSVRCMLLAMVLLMSEVVWAATSYLNIFYSGTPLQGMEVRLNGEGLGATDSLGGVSGSVSAGEHSVELLRDGEVISSFTFSTEQQQDAEITVTFEDETSEPAISIEKYNESDTTAIGQVGGVITNADGQPIESAVISVAQSDTSIRSDASGGYKLDLPRGTYSLEVSHPVYASSIISNIRLLANVGMVASLKLRPKATGESSNRNIDVQIAPPIEDVLILGTFKSEGSSYELERFSTNVTDAIDIAQIERFGDSSAAAALNRIVGVNVSEGKYANVRGLDGRYISSTINGLMMPSTDPMRRDVQLDLFPANILQGIEIQKSYSPQMLGTTTGGSVRMTTRGLPGERVGKISVSTAYNSEFTGDNIISYESSNGDWLGYDSGLRELPDGVKNNTNGGQNLTICDVRIDPERCTDPLVAAALAISLEDDYNIDQLRANPDVSLSALYGDRYQLSAGDVGFYAALSYKNATKNRNEAVLSNRLEAVGSYERSQRNVSVSGYFVGGFEFREEDEILSKTILLRNSDDTTRLTQGVDDEDNSIQQTILEWVERQFISQQFTGSHGFNLGDSTHKLNWRLGFSETDRYEPDRRTYLYVNSILSTSAFERRWSELTEDSTDVGLDYVAPFNITNNIYTELTLGGLYSDRTREVSLYRFGIQGGENASEISFSRRENLENVLSYQNFVADRIRLTGNTTATDSYDSEEEITSYFISSKTEFAESWTLLAGVRQEEFNQALSYPNEESAASELESEEPLPVFSLSFRPMDEIQLRASWSDTVSYPGLIERSESQSFDPETDDAIFGNPDLIVSTISNYDFRAEYYFSDEESISLALFSKDIDSPIERAVTDGSGSASDGITFRNALSATVSGVELDFNKNVIDTASILTFVSGNISVIDSEVDLDEDSIRLEGIDAIGRELQGQAPLLANIQIGFDHIPTEQKITLLVNYTDEYIYRVTRGDNNGPEFFDSRVLVDLNYEKFFGESLTVKAQIKNLLNEEVSWTQNGRVIESYTEGSSISLSMAYEF